MSEKQYLIIASYPVQIQQVVNPSLTGIIDVARVCEL